ncbi:MAG: NTP transferase domain-containing protein, partial [Thermofilum sp.]|nr:NTP transferase domain-containing protein [Thermofilum sp.]
AGGEGKRMGFIKTPKPLIQLNGEPLLRRCIKYMASNGFKEFIVLTRFEEVVREAERVRGELGASARWCLDPPLKKVGKGKALKHAVEKGAIDANRRVFIAFPDDIFLDETLPLRFLSSHIEAVNRLGVHASVAVTTGLQLPWGCVETDPLGLATSFKEKPILPVHASVGLYILEPPALKMLLDLVDMSAEEAVEFENVLLPLLAEQRKLHAFIVPRDAWLPINTLKELETAEMVLKRNNIY